MFRVDQPEIPGGEETLERPEYCGDTYCPAGSVVNRKDIPAATVLVGAGSIYRIIPCDEAAAMKAIRAEIRPELILVKLAERNLLVAAAREQDPYSGTDDEDDNEDNDEAPF